MSEPLTTRRTLLAAAGATGLAATLIACGDSGGSGNGYGADGGGDGADGGGDSPAQEQTPEGGQDGGGADLAKTSQIPEGGGTVFRDEKIVVTQPTSGDFKAYSATCTHQGCVVREVKGGTINCACHGSKFSIADGSVADGPAQKPLPEARIAVDGDTIRLA
ncbi:Rieske (2Fe-2S) protein [Streptomyces gobiensis]|uniref:Rieske (2Fe-2S) protein n=1 Tax=Streptomyces gobiensis TaxID=2875706 RepID=UPI001E5EEF68|nr:Rieske (2Fe-2S) protein [Streptomyces gobiensis]UGY94819.1 Rieske (2Fe-2S) protein [Streptomyces gobiensis]